ncbi:MAG TPA: glycosyltransferase family 2 protein, partial [Candidatus Paceibacterota bacterium]|nr:glycosyltransferase family 2 protein [Candidatus Paceibacterota bacterium]
MSALFTTAANNALTPCLTVVMPVFNEAPTVAQVIRTVLEQPSVRELVVVDDGSSDNTWEILQTAASGDKRIRLLRHERNQGKGASLRAGFAQATSPVVLSQDADLEYDPREYPLLLQPILSDKADVVYGSRFLGAGAHRVLYFWHSVGNKALTLFSNMATNLNLSDIETGSKVFRRDVLRRLRLLEDRFGIEPEITAKISRLNVRIYEVPISYHGRT